VFASDTLQVQVVLLKFENAAQIGQCYEPGDDLSIWENTQKYF